ncbi:hypothetical protein [Anaeromyxobacter terrae]|uniref:hypothetical protein n=1 Tax=Anaeromyxobacter terrae TaxID=2925406 RepID=UPI001F5AE517|nr:hypothetical protein [Anaeromyxobacter sp. SG22]
MRLRLEIAARSADVLRCRQLVGEVYHRRYGVVFSSDTYDLDRKIEPWPHRFLMGFLKDELAAVSGLYLRNTYVERFGGVTDDEIGAHLREAGLEGRYDPAARRELTKLVIAPRLRNSGLGPLFVAIAHARAFVELDAALPPLVTFCVVRSMRRLVERHGIRPRHLKPFPHYKVHELYRSERNPMDSYLVIPELDVPAAFRDLRIPGEHELSPWQGDER